MKKPNITPGEWTVSNCSQSGTIWIEHRDARHKEAVCRLGPSLRDGAEEANATAIAALPKLLEALEMVLPDWHKEDDGTAHDLGIVAELTVGNVRAIKSALLAAGYTE